MLFENIRIAFGGLFANKLRTLLSVLGILIGVMSVTLLLAVGAGASKFISGQVGQLGTNTLFVFPKGSGTEVVSATARRPVLTRRDLAVLNDPVRSPSLLRAVPELTSSAIVSTKRASQTLPITGTTAGWVSINNRTITEGLNFTVSDVQSRRRVAVIGPKLARKMFPGESAVGKPLRIGTTTFEVIGIFAKRGGGIIGDQDNVIVVPETAVQDAITGAFETYTVITAQMRPGYTNGAQAEVTANLMREHGIKDKKKADFDFFDNAQLTATSSTISTALSALLGLIAGISLLVGGIGVMNIMLVTVTERTREIGIRKALGAKRWHLLTQFLVESVVLTGVGGVAGAGVGAALSQIKAAGFAPILQPWMLALAIGVSAFIGVTFGVYPANKAAKLRPIDALRFE
jgi:putative ABC transport system permease protein